MTNIEAFDCLPFSDMESVGDILHTFVRSQQKNIFRISNECKEEDESKLAEYDYRNNNWIAGRFVGEAIFRHKEKEYKVTVRPRFGEKALLRMLEEIFNIRITASTSQSQKIPDWQHYIKRIIALIWSQKLANANLHGVPRINVAREYKGETIRGRLYIRKTGMTLYKSNTAVSVCIEKQMDQTIAQIILQAYNILQKDFINGAIKIPDTALDAINQIYKEVGELKHLSINDYKSIKYKDIYLTWKPIVDLSWDIINRKQLSLKQEKAVNGLGFFIDMAEIWEHYIRSMLKRYLLPLGWHCKYEKQVAYKGYFFQRDLIPDLVFERNNEVAIWDAKYKRMTGTKYDVDRTDFFQIHTYVQYHLKHKKVKASGLLYPISISPNFDNYRSNYLLNEKGYEINFSIDGIELTERIDNDDIKNSEIEFVKRIVKSISL